MNTRPPALALELRQLYRQVNQADSNEIVLMMRDGSALCAARLMFSSKSAQLEQDAAQRKPMSMLEVRRFEFKAALDIIARYHGLEPTDLNQPFIHD